MVSTLQKVLYKIIHIFDVSASLQIAIYLNVMCLFLMITLIVTFNIWEMFTAGLVTFVSLLVSIALWKLVCRKLLKVFRNFIFAFFTLCFSAVIFVLIGALGMSEAKIPLYSILSAASLGLSTEMAAIFLAYDMFRRAIFCERAGLGREMLLKQFSLLPQQMQSNEDIVNAYVAAANLPWLFANSDYMMVVIVIGGILEALLKCVYKGNQSHSLSKKAKVLGLNVAYEDNNAHQSASKFDVEHFWHNVRSKYAHSIRIQKIAPATFGVNEPSEEIARKSIGLLGVFLRSYSDIARKSKSPKVRV